MHSGRLAWNAALVAIVAVAYLPATRGGFIWDDDRYVSHNPTLRSVDGLVQTWVNPTANPQYYPLVFTSFWLEYHLFGLNPAAYHWTNILLHGLCAVLFWHLLELQHLPAAWFAAALF